MPLDDTHTKTVGFVIGDDEVVGTFFVVQRSDKCFMLTAAHNLVPHNAVKTRIRTHDGSTLYEWDPGPWFFPDLDGGLDLAINCFDPASSEDLLFTAIPIDEQGMDVMGAHPKLGTTVYFAGLLAPVERMGEAGIPMVRSGSLGALYQPGVAYDESWGPMTAHLIDTRSWGGFSGSPCWWQMTIRAQPSDPKRHP